MGIQFTVTVRPKTINKMCVNYCPITSFFFLGGGGGWLRPQSCFGIILFGEFLEIHFFAILFLIHSNIKTFQKDLLTLLQLSLMFKVKYLELHKVQIIV